MFINYQGPPSRDPVIRAAINLHLSRVAKAKRPSKYDVERLDRRQAQQRRRRREAEERYLRDEAEQQALMLGSHQQGIRNALSISGDLLTSVQHRNENLCAWKAARDCEWISIEKVRG